MPRQVLRPAGRQALAALATEVLGPGHLEEGPQGPTGGGSWTGTGCSVSYAMAPSGGMSHVLVGILPGGRLGVDLALAGAVPDWLAVATLYLGPAVAAELAAVPPEDLPLAFARNWAALEAVAKCLGSGLAEWDGTPPPAEPEAHPITGLDEAGTDGLVGMVSVWS